MLRAISAAGPSSGAYVADATTGRTLFSWRADTPRSLASNTKLFTVTTALATYGTNATLATTLLGTGSLDSTGAYQGSLYLRGAGDPTFGSRTFARASYGSDATVDALAESLRRSGVNSVSGSIVGDESLFDALRGGPDSGFGLSIDVGPLSALSYDRGLADPGGHGFQRFPAAFAADRMLAALRHVHIRVDGGARTGTTPAQAVELAEVRSPTVARLVQLTDKESDNLFAELLTKGLAVDGAPGGPLRQPGDPLPSPPVPGQAPAAPPRPLPAAVGSTTAGAQAAMAFARSFGLHPTIVDGSGLSRRDRATPRQVATLLRRVRRQPYFPALVQALPVAGRDGTLRLRMRSGPAHDRCRAKTGTLSNVSALSGLCTIAGGRSIIFSILMNGVSATPARALQDRIVQAIAAYR
ncbi:MAG: D-alanyl-D-alanine carboxypeptidase/D-alanyl-D-alanine-endopeptidase [Thermoleophilaceae bacterium]